MQGLEFAYRFGQVTQNCVDDSGILRVYRDIPVYARLPSFILLSFHFSLHGVEKRLKYAKENTDLPKEPDYNRIEDLVASVNADVVRTYLKTQDKRRCDYER